MAETDRFALLCCSLIFLTVAVDAISTGRSIVRGPLNTAIDLSAEEVTRTVLGCEASAPRPTSRISWTEYITNANGAPISDSDQILGGHPNAARYSIDWDGNTVFDLVINPTLSQDGGVYRCIDINDVSVPQYAQLITLAGPPNCTTNIPNTGNVIEDQYYTIECNVYYQGKVAPTMTWTGPEGFSWTTITTETSVWAGLAVNVTRFMAAQTFDLVVNFTADGFQQEFFASNVPTLNFTLSTPELIVQWGPKNLYYVPVQPSYEIGTEIQCQADANPQPNYFWQNLETNERWDDYRLYIDDRLIGSQRMWCHAQNIIGNNVFSSDLFFNLTVNPRTTTPEPATTSTTTAPPPQSSCDNLSGRWASYTPHRMEMCLEVNNNNYGRIVGLLRNESDPIFIELRGRAAPQSTNQVGVTGIWPFNQEVITFIGTCQKCFGNETMWVNAIVRTVSDNTECANPGPSVASRMYQFFRVGPPCRGLRL